MTFILVIPSFIVLRNVPCHSAGLFTVKPDLPYINWLQTDKVLILPKFNAPEDKQAFEQISTLMPEYEGKIETVDATDLIRHEGCLNCASWTVYEPEEGPRWEL